MADALVAVAAFPDTAQNRHHGLSDRLFNRPAVQSFGIGGPGNFELPSVIIVVNNNRCPTFTSCVAR